jgi:hypothetical protein
MKQLTGGKHMKKQGLHARNWRMYSFVHSKIRNRLEGEKAKILVYIYTNSWFLRQRSGADPVCYHDDNIFSKDSVDDGRILSDTDDNNNDDNNGGGHNGNDGDASNGGEENPKECPLINPKNVHQENPLIGMRSITK